MRGCYQTNITCVGLGTQRKLLSVAARHSSSRFTTLIQTSSFTSLVNLTLTSRVIPLFLLPSKTFELIRHRRLYYRTRLRGRPLKPTCKSTSARLSHHDLRTSSGLPQSPRTRWASTYKPRLRLTQSEGRVRGHPNTGRGMDLDRSGGWLGTRNR